MARMLLGRRVLSVAAALLVAVVTLLPRRTERQMSILIEGRQLGGELGEVVTFVLIGLVGLAVIGILWRSRIASRLNMSWPLLVVGVLYILGFVALASSTVRAAVFGLLSTGMGVWLRRVSSELDAEHAIAYATLMILVALAWRRKIALWWLALGVFAYGYALELSQQLVPGREYRWQDVVANGVGIVIGLIGMLLFDLVAGARTRTAVEVHRERRRRRSERSSRSASGSSRGSMRAGLIIALAGLLIAVASVLAGSVAELQLAQVGWQILTQFSAVYAFTFWLGVLVMLIGGLMLRGIISGAGALRPPHDAMRARRHAPFTRPRR